MSKINLPNVTLYSEQRDETNHVATLLSRKNKTGQKLIVQNGVLVSVDEKNAVNGCLPVTDKPVF